MKTRASLSSVRVNCVSDFAHDGGNLHLRSTPAPAQVATPSQHCFPLLATVGGGGPPVSNSIQAKTRKNLISNAALLLAESYLTRTQSTTWTCQGSLTNGKYAANGLYGFFGSAVHDAVRGRAPMGGTLTTTAVPVSIGVFAVTLDLDADVLRGAAGGLGITASRAPSREKPTLRDEAEGIPLSANSRIMLL